MKKDIHSAWAALEAKYRKKRKGSIDRLPPPTVKPDATPRERLENIKALLERDDALARCKGVEAAMLLKPEEIVDILKSHIRDDNSHVRFTIVEALAEALYQGNVQAIRLLERMKQDADPEISDHAENCLRAASESLTAAAAPADPSAICSDRVPVSALGDKVGRLSVACASDTYEADDESLPEILGTAVITGPDGELRLEYWTDKIAPDEICLGPQDHPIRIFFDGQDDQTPYKIPRSGFFMPRTADREFFKGQITGRIVPQE